ncbi:MAG: (R)-stereoselective amidase [Verrucomicrobiota bacterium]
MALWWAVKLALIQMRVVGGEPQRNLRRAEALIAESAALGAEVALLPEAMNLGWTHPSAHAAADPIPTGESCARIGAAARRHGLFVCAGLIERAGADIFNSAVLVDPRGEVILHHRKLNELRIAHPLYAGGDRLGVARTPLGAFGLMICADGFSHGQSVGRTLGLMGADVILSPCAWAAPAGHDNSAQPYGQLWIDNYGPVARDYGLWIAGCSNVGPIEDGPWRGRACIGNSLVVGPQGEPVLRGPYGVDAETVLEVEIHLTARPRRAEGG